MRPWKAPFLFRKFGRRLNSTKPKGAGVHTMTNSWSVWKDSLLSPTMVHTRFNSKRLLYLFYCCCYFYLVIFKVFFIKRLHNQFLTFSFGRYISSHPKTICSKPVILIRSVYTHNFFEQILVGLDPRWEKHGIPNNCGFYF